MPSERFFVSTNSRKIHTEGIGVGGMYPLEIAETKMNQVLNLAKEASHPLQCIIEKI